MNTMPLFRSISLLSVASFLALLPLAGGVAWIIGALFLIFATPSPAMVAGEGARADCTVYYTPRESGFAPGQGFDLRPETRPGLEGEYYPADFLRAVKVEGHGRLEQPHGTDQYIYFNGRWGYTDCPKGIGQQPLIPLQSCAVSVRSPNLKRGVWVQMAHATLPAPLRNRWWKVSDVGGGVQSRQVDLYWGEDDPKGPGSKVYQPAGTTFTGVRDAQMNFQIGDAS
ncbi:hypothetical protein [Verrucomicrobium sp. GAS474]|uniref:hypothetical protein n=1 Tax=Verrucomicrobium sp. GAS474 TaxID=1882831 RepID=UPI000B80E501|nr:hypothetical protein [Verrucomicrobium sp. GAS474]